MSSLSVCMAAGRAPAAVRAILGLLRRLADEIVLAADSRRAEEILGACGDLVDRPLVFDYEPTPSRYKGWLHHQCTADWILQLDDDEVPSRGLLDALPELVADRRLSRFDLPVRELFPDTGHYLTSHPWGPGYRLRMVRNLPGLWSFDGSERRRDGVRARSGPQPDSRGRERRRGRDLTGAPAPVRRHRRAPRGDCAQPRQRVLAARSPVEVPERTGRYVLEVDVVHELVRWFGCAARLEVDVEPLHAPPDGLGLARPDMARIQLTG